ncbi:hypothetical protein BD626DRAFT_574589 [Schizophyllum amplum]|uniref:Ribosomal RNA methyltransferase FtsJ domain-containing protein n=1 Tax=Schizophyllum amplum TaxID=97359 RepID=A0A550BXZ6_9AGAR|nr:hypothetical protein BD626DRAFT_574589 [Auriculariopsis ampla]
MPALTKNAERENLQRLKRQNRERPLHLTHMRHQERNADEATPEMEGIWFENMKEVMREIDWATEGTALPREGSFNFLDLGCCPGGFSSYILKKNPDAVGVGVSLPDGHNYRLEEELRPRHELIWADLLRYRLRPTPEGADLVDLPWGFCCRQFDLVVLDGHPLRLQKARTTSVGPRLLVAQLILSLQTVRRGGTIIVKLSAVERPDTQAILYMLDALASQLTTCKPVSMHATRDTFYVVAQDVQMEGIPPASHGWTLRMDRLLWDLMLRWATVTFGALVDDLQAWDFVCPHKLLLTTYRKRLDKLAEPVLRVQCLALEGLRKQELGDGL